MLEYFGTALNQAGHYFWTLEGDKMYRSRRDYNTCPFNPEALPYYKKNEQQKDGTIRFYQFAGFTICAIDGSCYDKRPNSKTVFFIEEELSEEKMKKKIMSVPIAQQILYHMTITFK